MTRTHPSEDHGGVPEFSLAGIERRLDELRLTEDVTKLRREVHALLEVAVASLQVVETMPKMMSSGPFADALNRLWQKADRFDA